MADPIVPDDAATSTPVPPASPAPAVPPTSRRSLSRSPLAVGVAGLVVGALVAGVPLLLSQNTKAFGATGDALNAPGAIGGFSSMARNSKVDAATVKRIQSQDAVSTKNLSAAYGGAAAVVGEYSNADISTEFELEAVRAQSPKPFFPYVDAHAIGMDKPSQEIVTFGRVACLVANIPVGVGQQEQPQSATAITCERTSAHLTVRLRFGGGGDLMHSPQQAAALVDTAWSAIS